jgi:hypothetical protein
LRTKKCSTGVIGAVASTSGAGAPFSGLVVIETNEPDFTRAALVHLGRSLNMSWRFAPALRCS